MPLLLSCRLVFRENDMQLGHVMSCVQGLVLLVIVASQAAVVIVMLPGSPGQASLDIEIPARLLVRESDQDLVARVVRSKSPREELAFTLQWSETQLIHRFCFPYA